MPFLQMCLVLRFLVLLFGGSLCLRVLLLALLSRCLLLAPVFVPFVHLLAALMPLFLADMAPVPPLRGRSGSVGLHHLIVLLVVELLVLVLLLVCSLLRVVCFFGFNVRLVALFLALFL